MASGGGGRRRPSSRNLTGRCYLSEFDHLTFVRLLIARHRAHPETGGFDEVLRLLDRQAEAAATFGRAGSLIRFAG